MDQRIYIYISIYILEYIGSTFKYPIYVQPMMISPQTIDIQHLRHLWESQLSISCAPQVLMASLAARVMLPWENLIRWPVRKWWDCGQCFEAEIGPIWVPVFREMGHVAMLGPVSPVRSKKMPRDGSHEFANNRCKREIRSWDIKWTIHVQSFRWLLGWQFP